jgi:hypothetical protein
VDLQGDKDPRMVGRMNLTQFKALCLAAHVTVCKFIPERLDEIFTAVAASPTSLERKMESMAASTMTFLDFVLALVHVAYHRFAATVRRCKDDSHSICKSHSLPIHLNE